MVSTYKLHAVCSIEDKLTAFITVISNNLSVEFIVHLCEGKLIERDNEKSGELNNLVIFIT